MKVYGHRGASASAPENTIEAFHLARAQGADGVELDVRRTSDGALVVHHDATIDGLGAIVDLRREELPASVPTLADALDACRGMVVNIEIKNLPGEPDFDERAGLALDVVAALERRSGHDRVLVSCFHPPTLELVRRVAPTVETALLTMVEPSALDGVRIAAERGHVAVHPHDFTVDEVLVSAAHAVGIQVNVWTVNDPARVVQLAELGVDGVVTDEPAVALAALGRT